MARVKKNARTAAGHRRGDARWQGRRSIKGLGLLLLLVVCIVASGLQVVITAHELRTTHRLLQEARDGQDLLLAEHSRLLLERGAVVAYQHIERVAVAELGMRFPERVERIAP